MQLFGTWRDAWRRRVATWVLRRQGPDAMPVIVQRQRIYILPTRAGFGFAALLLFMLLAGLNYGNNLALLATFLMMGFVLVGMNLCHRNLQGLRLISATTVPGFAGDYARVELTLDSGAAQPRGTIRIACSNATTLIDSIEAGSSARADLAVSTPRRGRQPIDRIQISTTFPFGLFRAWTWVHLPLQITVYPRPHGSLPLPVGRDSHEVGPANAGHGVDEWSGMRPFRDGDSPRQVVWTAYARELPLLVKEYGGAAAEWLHFDLTQMQSGDIETQLQQICRWILDADSRGSRYALSLPGQRFKADQSAAHRQACLTALAHWQAA